MSDKGVSPWLAWARELEALGQTGLAYSEDDYHAGRYRRLLEIAAEIVADRSPVPKEEALRSFTGQQGYATPKVDVRAAAVRDGKILLVQERADGKWCMPGGWADVGEAPAAAVAREAREESGFAVAPRTIVGLYDANRGGRPLAFYHAYKIVFLCDITGGEATPSAETPAVAFFPFDDLPPLSTERTDERHLADVRTHAQNPAEPAYFD